MSDPREDRRKRLGHFCVVVCQVYEESVVAADIRSLLADEQRLREAKDEAYLERNRLVAALARLAPALGWKVGLRRTSIEGWSDDWHGCIWFDTPAGQLSWHYNDAHAELYDGLPSYEGPAWDGHTTPEKYARLARAALSAPPEDLRGVLDMIATIAEVLVKEGAVHGPLALSGAISRARAALAPPEPPDPDYGF